jgi:hypothetical protein
MRVKVYTMRRAVTFESLSLRKVYCQKTPIAPLSVSGGTVRCVTNSIPGTDLAICNFVKTQDIRPKVPIREEHCHQDETGCQARLTSI